VIDVIGDGIEFNNICRVLYMAPWDLSAPRIHDQVKQSQAPCINPASVECGRLARDRVLYLDQINFVATLDILHELVYYKNGVVHPT
jgi:hypothetical protein